LSKSFAKHTVIIHLNSHSQQEITLLSLDRNYSWSEMGPQHCYVMVQYSNPP